MDLQKVKEKVVVELGNFLDRSGEDRKPFLAKVNIMENVLEHSFEKEESKNTNEIFATLLVNTPEGMQVAYNTVISFTVDDDIDTVFKAIENAFPSKEQIEEAKAKAKEEEERKRKFQEQMQNINPQEIAKMMQQEGSSDPSVQDSSEESNDTEPQNDQEDVK